jgi:hypothetical protein
VYIRFAGADDCEFAGSVIATESTRCMLAMPRQFFSCCGVDTSDPATSLQVPTLTYLHDLSAQASWQHSKERYIQVFKIKSCSPCNLLGCIFRYLYFDSPAPTPSASEEFELGK